MNGTGSATAARAGPAVEVTHLRKAYGLLTEVALADVSNYTPLGAAAELHADRVPAGLLAAGAGRVRGGVRLPGPAPVPLGVALLSAS